MIKLFNKNRTFKLTYYLDNSEPKTIFLCRYLTNNQRMELLGSTCGIDNKNATMIMDWGYKILPKCVIDISGFKIKKKKINFGGEKIKALDEKWINDNLEMDVVSDIVLKILQKNGILLDEKEEDK